MEALEIRQESIKQAVDIKVYPTVKGMNRASKNFIKKHGLEQVDFTYNDHCKRTCMALTIPYSADGWAHNTIMLTGNSADGILFNLMAHESVHVGCNIVTDLASEGLLQLTDDPEYNKELIEELIADITGNLSGLFANWRGGWDIDSDGFELLDGGLIK